MAEGGARPTLPDRSRNQQLTMFAFTTASAKHAMATRGVGSEARPCDGTRSGEAAPADLFGARPKGPDEGVDHERVAERDPAALAPAFSDRSGNRRTQVVSSAAKAGDHINPMLEICPAPPAGPPAASVRKVIDALTAERVRFPGVSAANGIHCSGLARALAFRVVIVRTATCRCGQLSATCTGEPVRVSVCHCLDCQKRSGSAFAAQARWPDDCVHLVGAYREWSTQGEGGRRATFRFCGTCGATVTFVIDALPGVTGVPTGAFADPAFPAPAVSVYEERRHPWLAIVGSGIEHID